MWNALQASRYEGFVTGSRVPKLITSRFISERRVHGEWEIQTCYVLVAAVLKVMKQRCHFHICLRFAFKITRNFSRAMAWMCGWSLCGNLPCVKVMHVKSDWKILRRKRIIICMCVSYGPSGLRQINKCIMFIKHPLFLKYNTNFLLIWYICHVFVIECSLSWNLVLFSNNRVTTLKAVQLEKFANKEAELLIMSYLQLGFKQGRRQRGASGARGPPIWNLCPSISRLASWLLHTSNTVF